MPDIKPLSPETAKALINAYTRPHYKAFETSCTADAIQVFKNDDWAVFIDEDRNLLYFKVPEV